MANSRLVSELRPYLKIKRSGDVAHWLSATDSISSITKINKYENSAILFMDTEKYKGLHEEKTI